MFLDWSSYTAVNYVAINEYMNNVIRLSTSMNKYLRAVGGDKSYNRQGY